MSGPMNDRDFWQKSLALLFVRHRSNSFTTVCATLGAAIELAANTLERFRKPTGRKHFLAYT